MTKKKGLVKTILPEFNVNYRSHRACKGRKNKLVRVVGFAANKEYIRIAAVHGTQLGPFWSIKASSFWSFYEEIE